MHRAAAAASADGGAPAQRHSPPPAPEQGSAKRQRTEETSAVTPIGSAEAASSTANVAPAAAAAAAAAAPAASAVVTAATAPVTRYVCIVEYMGGDYHGWSPSSERPRQKSIAGALEAAIAGLCGDDVSKVRLMGSGRTDAGVHAIGQVFHVDLDRGINKKGTGHAPVLEAFKFERAVNHRLLILGHTAIRLVHTTIVPDPFPHPNCPRFHARHAAVNRSYIYRIWLTGPRSPGSILEHGRCLHIRYAVDLTKLQQALDLFVGVHDFVAFQSSGCAAPSSIRLVSEARVAIEPRPWHDVYARSSEAPCAATKDARMAEAGTMLSLHISSRSFLYHQVRHMVGASLAVASGRWTLAQLREALSANSVLGRTDARERERIRKLKQMVGIASAPPQGLFLHKVEYPFDLFDWSKRDVPARRSNNNSSNNAGAAGGAAGEAEADQIDELMELDDQEPDSPVAGDSEQSTEVEAAASS